MLYALLSYVWQLEREGRIYSSRSVDGLVYSLWSLLPSFCNYPVDTAESFKDLKEALCRNLQEQPDIRGIICSSLQILIHQNKSIVERKGDPSAIEASIPRQQAMARYTPEVAADNLEVLKKSACELLSLLSKIFMETPKDVGGCLQVLLPSHLNKKTLCACKAALPSHAITCM